MELLLELLPSTPPFGEGWFPLLPNTGGKCGAYFPFLIPTSLDFDDDAEEDASEECSKGFDDGDDTLEECSRGFDNGGAEFVGDVRRANGTEKADDRTPMVDEDDDENGI